MERVLDRCAGLDVHKKTVTVCLRVPDTSGGRAQQVRTFATTAAELLRLRDWLEAHRVSHVAMESTGVYWRPVFYDLEEACTCILADAAQIAQFPGRKTDVNKDTDRQHLLAVGADYVETAVLDDMLTERADFSPSDSTAPEAPGA